MMILTQNPAIAPSQPVSRAVGAVRRPVSLLLVEPLLDDDLELELAGAAFEDVRTAAGDVAARHGGLVSPESGVELVVAFGVDGAHEDDVVRAARAAVELREILRGRGVPARYAVGTGRVLVWDANPVLVGAVLGRTRRALHDAEADDVQLTAVAARVGGDAFDLDVDGRLLAVRSTRPLPASTPAPLVDRSDELAALHAAFDAVVATARPRHVVVVGEAGIGKSRLVEAFADDVPAVVLRAACVSYGEGISFLPLLDLGRRGRRRSTTALPPLGELTSADAAFAAAGALLEHFTRSGPVVVVLDDMHWAVPTFLDLVEYVVRTVDGPLLVVSMTRPELLEQRPSWREGAIGLRPAVVRGRTAPRRRVARARSGRRDARGLDPRAPPRAFRSSSSSSRRTPRSPVCRRTTACRRRSTRCSRAGSTRSSPASETCSRALPSQVAGSPSSSSARSPRTPELRELDGRLASLARHRLVRPTARRARVRAPSRPPGGVSRDRAPRARGHARAARAMAGRRGRGRRGRRRAPRACGGRLDSRERSRRDGPRTAAELLGSAGFRALMAADHAAAANLLGRASALLPDDDPARMELECLPGAGTPGPRRRRRARHAPPERRRSGRDERASVASSSVPRSSWCTRSSRRGRSRPSTPRSS